MSKTPKDPSQPTSGWHLDDWGPRDYQRILFAYLYAQGMGVMEARDAVESLVSEKISDGTASTRIHEAQLYGGSSHASPARCFILSLCGNSGNGSTIRGGRVWSPRSSNDRAEHSHGLRCTIAVARFLRRTRMNGVKGLTGSLATQRGSSPSNYERRPVVGSDGAQL